MHEMQTIVTDDHSVRLPCEVIRCSLCQITLALVFVILLPVNLFVVYVYPAILPMAAG